MNNLTIYTFHATIRCQWDKRNVKETRITQEAPTMTKAMDLAEVRAEEEYPNCDISLSFGNRMPEGLRWAGHEKCVRPRVSAIHDGRQPLTIKLGEMMGA